MGVAGETLGKSHNTKRPPAPAAAAGGRARRQPSVGNGRAGCTIPSHRGDRPSNPDRLFCSSQRGKGHNTRVYSLTHISMEHTPSR